MSALKEATVQRYRYDAHDQLERHLAHFINAYNCGRRLKTLKNSHQNHASTAQTRFISLGHRGRRIRHDDP